MQVTVDLFSYFRQGRFKQSVVELAQGATVTDLLLQLQINPREVGVIVIDGKISPTGTRLESGNHVTFIPIIGGG